LAMVDDAATAARLVTAAAVVVAMQLMSSGKTVVVPVRTVLVLVNTSEMKLAMLVGVDVWKLGAKR